MDVYQVSANMIAFSEFVVTAAKIAYGDKITVNAEVAGFGKGSFLTDLVFNFANHSIPIFTSFSPSELLAIINESFALWKHLKGSPPRSVTEGVNQSVVIENNNGQVIQIKTESFTLVMNERSAEAIGQFVKKTLSDEGIDSLEIGCGNDVVANVKQSEAGYFSLVRPSESITDSIIQMSLIIEAPVFKDGNKWRFSDGQNSFFADIIDMDFLSAVDEGEQFGKGDLLRVDLRIKQERAGAKITTERFIEKVHEHRKDNVHFLQIAITPN